MPEAASPSRGRTLPRGGAFALGVALFAWTLRDLDAQKLRALLHEVGPLAALVLLPQAIGILVHTAAWRELLAALGYRAPLFALARSFLSSEAARMAMPAGAAVGESVAAYELKSRFEVPWTTGLASLAAKKAWVLATHAACFVLLLVFGRAALAEMGRGAPAGWAIPWATAGSALSLALAGGTTLALLSSRRAARFVTRLATRTRFARLRGWAEEQQARPEAVAAAAIPPARHALAALFMLGQWAAEIFETWLVLHLLGVHVTAGEAALVELGGSIARAAAFIVPGSLGVLDASYVGMLAALGVPGATDAGVTFVLLKRAKDATYVALGFGALALDTKRVRAAALAAAGRRS